LEYEFYPSDKEVELLSNELLQGKFTFSKSLKCKLMGSNTDNDQGKL
jgi:hypothetical protein